ncbi:MAG: glycoside hydrolase family 2 TIM barrel-domain containing protein, partial [Pseudomonadota bacterium]
DLRVNLTDEGTVRIGVTASAPGRAEVSAFGGVHALDLPDGQGGLHLPAPDALWAPEHPHLHDIAVRLDGDRVADRVGLRTLATDGTDILLNGKPIWLRGICCHEDDAGTGRVTSEADLIRRFDHVQALGANAVRLSHSPHHERAAQIADARGLLLIEEIPVYWAIAYDTAATLADATNQLREMIRRDANRASVILWGVGNENEDTDARLGFMTALAEAALAEDPSRLITAACLIDRTTFAVADRLAAALDVVGVNAYFGWYEHPMDGLAALLANTALDRPLIVTETGADAVTGTVGTSGSLYSETYQAEVLATQIDIAGAAPGVAGIFPWILYDFRTERRQTRLNTGWNLKGLIDRDKTRKKAAF